MGAGDLELLDLLVTTDSDGEPRLKVGDYASGQGVGQDCVYLANDGFVSQPNPPDSGGGCGSAICWTPGDDRLVIASVDNRYNGKAGGLAPGDRAIVSNCDAFFKLSQAGNSITVSSTNASTTTSSGQVATQCGSTSLTVNGTSVSVSSGNVTLATADAEVALTGTSASVSGESITLATADIELELTGTSAALSYQAGPVSASVNLSAAGLVLTFTSGVLQTCSISLLPFGVVNVVASGSLNFNGQPFVFAGGFWT